METRFRRHVRRQRHKLRRRVDRLRVLVEKGVLPDIGRYLIEKCPPQWLEARIGRVQYLQYEVVEFVEANDHNTSQVAFDSDSDYSEAESQCTSNYDSDPGLT